MRRLLSRFYWIMLFLSTTVISCCASSNYGLYNLSLIPGTEVTNFTWSINLSNNSQPVLTTDYPVAKIREYGVTTMDFSYYRNGDYFCDLEFYCRNGNISFRGYGRGMEVMNFELEEIVQLIKEYGLTPVSVKIVMEGSAETKELYFSSSDRQYTGFHHYSNDFFYGNGFFYVYSYDENGTLSESESSFRINQKDLMVTFDKFGRIESAYIPSEEYKYQKMTGLFYLDGQTYTVQDLGFLPENLVAKAAIDDSNAPADPYLIDTGITDPIFWNNIKNYDEDEDGILSAGEAQVITYLNLRDMGIKSLDGINYFTRLQTLWCENNEITHLDLSNCTQLTILSCDNNQITSLSVYPESSFDVFSCQNNAYHITSPFDITKLPGNFIPERASTWNGGTLNGTILIANDGTVTYTYDYTGNNNRFISCELIIDDEIPTTLNSLILPENLNVISTEAFVNVNTNMVIIPENVSRIENNAFASCSKLYTAVFYSTNVEISDNIFGDMQNIDIWCYENSSAHIWAQNKNYNIKFIGE